MLLTHRFVQHRARAIVALLALAVVALVLAACGGSDGGSDSGGSSADAETLLRQTFTGTHDIRSGKADVQLRVDVSGDPSIRGPVTVSISGPFQSAGSDQLPKFDMALDAHAQGQGFKAGLTSTSDKMFVNFGGTSYEVPAELVARLKDGYGRSQEQGSSNPMDLGSLGIDPMSWLQDPTVAGTETKGGVETDHITAGVDVNALLDDVDTLLARLSAQGGLPTGQQIPSRIPAGDRQQIEDAIKNAEIEVWSGTEDHTLRELMLSLDVEVPRSSTKLDLVLSIELSDLNNPQTIEAPATTRPLQELLGQVQGLLGGALGGGSLGGDSAGGAGGTSSAQLQKYSDCVQRAGSDVTEAQKCADLLTQ